jgi:hypothetical protein
MDLFSPLGASNCTFFYLVSVFSFILFLIVLVSGLMKKTKYWSMYLIASLTPLLTYYIYRIFYSMCVVTLK